MGKPRNNSCKINNSNKFQKIRNCRKYLSYVLKLKNEYQITYRILQEVSSNKYLELFHTNHFRESRLVFRLHSPGRISRTKFKSKGEKFIRNTDQGPQKCLAWEDPLRLSEVLGTTTATDILATKRGRSQTSRDLAHSTRISKTLPWRDEGRSFPRWKTMSTRQWILRDPIGNVGCPRGTSERPVFPRNERGDRRENGQWNGAINYSN